MTAARKTTDLEALREMLVRANPSYTREDRERWATMIRLTIDGDLYFDRETGALLGKDEADRRREDDDRIWAGGDE